MTHRKQDEEADFWQVYGVIDSWYHGFTRHHLVDVDPDAMENLLKPLMRLIHSYANEARKGLIDKVASPDFVYEVMNAPTNGAAVEWVKAELEQESKS